MKLKVFTFRFTPEAGGFDDAALVAFTTDKEVLAVHEHFFVHELVPTWALLVSYRDVPRAGERDRPREAVTDWRASLSAEEQRLFETLRTWRNTRAKRDAKPPYLLFSNRQMAEIAKRRPATLAALQEVEGFGEARAQDFGRELLALIGTIPGAVAPGAPEPEAPRAL